MLSNDCAMTIGVCVVISHGEYAMGESVLNSIYVEWTTAVGGVHGTDVVVY